MVRRLLLPFGLALLLGAASGALRAAEGPRASPPRDLDELSGLLDTLTRRLTDLVEQAQRDPRWRIVETYLAYQEEDFRRTRDRIDAEAMVAIAIDPTAAEDLRAKAIEALVDPKAKTWDPDLVEGKRQKKPRNDFAKRHLVKHLDSDEVVARKGAHALLMKLFPRADRDPDIGLYEAERGTTTQWQAAQKAWQRYLRK